MGRHDEAGKGSQHRSQHRLGAAHELDVAPRHERHELEVRRRLRVLEEEREVLAIESLLKLSQAAALMKQSIRRKPSPGATEVG